MLFPKLMGALYIIIYFFRSQKCAFSLLVCQAGKEWPHFNGKIRTNSPSYDTSLGVALNTYGVKYTKLCHTPVFKDHITASFSDTILDRETQSIVNIEMSDCKMPLNICY